MPRTERAASRPAARFGQRGGQSRSAAKVAAAKANGRAGGRPSKFAVGDPVVVRATAPKAHRGQRGIVQQIGPARQTFVITLANGRAVNLRSWWLTKPRRGVGKPE